MRDARGGAEGASCMDATLPAGTDGVMQTSKGLRPVNGKRRGNEGSSLDSVGVGEHFADSLFCY